MSTELLSAVGPLTSLEAYSVFLSHSQRTQPASLFTNSSQETLETWLWEQTVLPTGMCHHEPNQTNSVAKIKHSAEGCGEV